MRVECVHCEGVCTVNHELDHDFYKITFCPFCGEELNEELEDELEDYEDYDDE